LIRRRTGNVTAFKGNDVAGLGSIVATLLIVANSAKLPKFSRIRGLTEKACPSRTRLVLKQQAVGASRTETLAGEQDD